MASSVGVTVISSVVLCQAVDSGAAGVAGGGELGAAVDAGDLDRILDLDHRAGLSGQHDDVGQIIFACGILVVHAREQRK